MADCIVAVTGAGGFLASMLVKQLLEAGHTVRGTLRDPSNPKKVNHLKALPGAAERLSLFKADLLGAREDFVEVFRGCSIVYHTACPYVHADKAGALGEEFFVTNARDGTINVLEAALAAGSVTRVVMTSSTAAILRRLVPAGHAYSEADWNDPEELRTRGLVYAIGKTQQERAAWQWMAAHGRGDPTGIVAQLEAAGERRNPYLYAYAPSAAEGAAAAPTHSTPAPAPFDLVCLNPSFIGGPMLQPELNASSEVVWQYASGQKSKIVNAPLPWVDVRDVARAHVLAAGTPAASGRYMLIGSWEPAHVICDMIRPMLPGAPIPTEVDLPPTAEGATPATPAGPGLFDSSRVQKELGLKFTPLPELLEATVASLKLHGFVTA